MLINKFNEHDKTIAREIEYRLVASRSLQLFVNPIKVYSIVDIQKIHYFLFQDIYTWAGEYRKVNISKDGNAFMPIQSFDTAENYLNHLITDFHSTVFNRQNLITALTDILDNLNYFHPFREGNGHTQREVIRSLALSKGYECEISISQDDEIYHLYMDETVYGDKEKLGKLFNRLIKPKVN